MHVSTARATTTVVVTAALLAACATAPAPIGTRVPTEFPAAFYKDASERGEPVFRIVPERSEAIVLVYRGGSLAQIGHDHAIASRDVQGNVRLLLTPVEVRADLYVPLDTLAVDEPARRAAAGLAPLPEDADIAGTRRNMLETVLEAEHHPFVFIHVDAVERDADGLTLTAAVTLHGVTRSLRIPVEIAFDERALDVRGRFSLQQSDFGIAPFAVLGGRLQVQDRIDAQFQIHATRVVKLANQ